MKRKLSNLLYRQRFVKRKETTFDDTKSDKYYVIVGSQNDEYSYVKTFYHNHKTSFYANSFVIKFPTVPNEKDITISNPCKMYGSKIYRTTKVYEVTKRDEYLINLILSKFEKLREKEQYKIEPSWFFLDAENYEQLTTAYS